MKLGNLLVAQQNARQNILNTKKLQEVGKNSSGSKSAKRDPAKAKVGSATRPIGDSVGQFEESPVDFEEIQRSYYGESYIRRAIDNVSTLMFKSGYQFTGKKPEAVEYLKTRFRLIEEATGTPMDSIFTELGDNFVLFGNAEFIKVRGKDSQGDLNVDGYYGGDPIAGIFPASVVYTTIKRKDNGEIETIEIGDDSGSSAVDFKPEDVGMLTYRKPTGMVFGVPYFQNVLNDALILRQIENNVTRLIYRNLFPLTVYTVGSTTPGFEATNAELEEAMENIEKVPDDGVFVVSERHKLETVSSNSAMMDASAYLKYFRQRVFVGLGMSESTMGIGDSTNKSTADNQNSDLNDLVKDFQRRFQAQIQVALIDELLFEGGYDPVMNPEDSVNFEFVEIEQAAKMARENHSIQKYNNNGIDFDEYRAELGYESKEDMSKFAMNLKSKNNPQDNPSLDDNTEDGKGASSDSSKNVVDNKDKPENQHGKQDGPTKSQTKEQKNRNTVLTESRPMVNLSVLEEVNDDNEPIHSYWRIIRNDLKDRLKKKESFEQALGFSTELSRKSFSRKIYASTIKAYKDNLTSFSTTVLKESKSIDDYISRQSDKVTERLFNELSKRFNGIAEKEQPIEYVDAIFGTFEKRIERMSQNQKEEGKQIAKAMDLFETGQQFITVLHDENDCEKCEQHKKIFRTGEWWKEIPPYHPSCHCDIN